MGIYPICFCLCVDKDCCFMRRRKSYSLNWIHIYGTRLEINKIVPQPEKTYEIYFANVQVKFVMSVEIKNKILVYGISELVVYFVHMYLVRSFLPLIISTIRLFKYVYFYIIYGWKESIKALIAASQQLSNA